MPRNTDTSAATQWHIDKRLERIKLYEQNPRKCLNCNRSLSYDEDKRKKFCSKSCAATLNGSLFPKRGVGKNSLKPCSWCQVPTKQHCCSHKCRIESKRANQVRDWLSGQIISESEDMPLFIRQYMLDESKNQCSRCGWAEINLTTGKIPLTIDHIDGNSRNHSKDNLKVLCPNCHALTSTYGILNKGNGRKKRR